MLAQRGQWTFLAILVFGALSLARNRSVSMLVRQQLSLLRVDAPRYRFGSGNEMAWKSNSTTTTTATTTLRSSPSSPRPRAILHLGPKKTGTTSIQSWMSDHSAILAEKDGWHWVPFVGHPVKYIYRKPEVVDRSFAIQNFSNNMAWHAQQGHNVVVSHEFLAIIPRESALVWNRLKEILEPFDVSLIFTYRRLYAWLLSNHADEAKFLSTNFPLCSTFGELLESKIRLGNNPSPKLALTAHDPFRGSEGAVHPVQAIVKLYEEQGFSNYTIVNMHNTSDILPTFVCEALGPTSHACQLLTSPCTDNDNYCNPKDSATGQVSSSSEQSAIRKNLHSVAWEYNRLARAFMVHYANLTTNSILHRQWAVSMGEVIRHRQEQKLNLTLGDFPQTCPTKAQLDMLLLYSLKMEHDLFPQFFASPGGQEGLRTHFQSFVERGAFCNINPEAVVKDPDFSKFSARLVDELQKKRAWWVKQLSRRHGVDKEKVVKDKEEKKP